MQRSKDKVVLHDYWADHVDPWLKGLVRHFESRGTEVEIWDRFTLKRGKLNPLNRPYQSLRGFRARRAIARALDGVSHVFMWNGQNDHHDVVLDLCAKRRIPVSFLEVGYFPQKKYFTIDAQGINATSALMEDPLDWIDETHMAALEAHRASYLDGYRWTGGDHVLVPLQLSHDTNIRDHSQFQDMQEFVEHCEATIEGEILFKTHPLDESEYVSQHEVRRKGSFLEMAQHCREVVGLNSTCLLESALMGVPTTALGNGFLRAQGHQTEKLLAALVDRQVPVDCDDVSRWLERYAAQGVS